MEKKKTYSELLKDPRWQKRRLEILNRDDWTCQICGVKNRTLHVHHLAYSSDVKPWEYKDFQLITLCEECHTAEHERFDEVLDWIKSIRHQGVTLYEISRYLEECSVGIWRDPYFIHDVCFGIKTDGTPFSYVWELKRLADRRNKAVDDVKK